MGTWGPGIFHDDTACEVRDEYVKNLKAGLSDAEAGQKILKRFGSLLRDVQVASMVYLSLADTQWKYGRVDRSVKKRALDLIKRGADLAQWKEDSPNLVNARKKALEALKKRLESKPKARRAVKVEIPKPLKTWTDAKRGTIFLLPLSKSSFAALVLVAHIETGYRTKDPMFAVLKWKGRRVPTPSELRGRKFVAVPESSRLGCDTHQAIGFITENARTSPLAGLTRTDVVLPNPPRYNGRGFSTGQERIAELVAAGVDGRRPPLTEWDRKFGRPD